VNRLYIFESFQEETPRGKFDAGQREAAYAAFIEMGNDRTGFWLAGFKFRRSCRFDSYAEHTFNAVECRSRGIDCGG
jgi:hypothetical protein